MSHPHLRQEPAATDRPAVGDRPDPAVGDRPDPAVGDRPDPAAGDRPDAAGAAIPAAPSAVHARWSRRLDRVLRGFAAVLSVAAAVLSGALELLLLPVRLGGQLVGVSILLALVGNLALAWFAHHAVGRRRAVALPWVAWTLVMFVAVGWTTAEGDYLLSSANWVPLPMILVGSVVFGVYTYRLILSPPPVRRPDPADAGAPPPSGPAD